MRERKRVRSNKIKVVLHGLQCNTSTRCMCNSKHSEYKYLKYMYMYMEYTVHTPWLVCGFPSIEIHTTHKAGRPVSSHVHGIHVRAWTSTSGLREIDRLLSLLHYDVIGGENQGIN